MRQEDGQSVAQASTYKGAGISLGTLSRLKHQVGANDVVTGGRTVHSEGQKTKRSLRLLHLEGL